jgi:hypothetical protein
MSWDLAKSIFFLIIEPSLINSFLIDWIAGSLGGFALTIVSHPFE